MNMNKYMRVLVPVAVGVVALGGGFFGGIKYQQHKTGSGRPNLQAFQNMGGRSGGNQQFRAGGGTGAGFRPMGGSQANGNFISGQIISADDKSITVKAADGSSKIVFYAPSTQTQKTVSASSTDLQVGANVVVTGQSNSDGSLTAQDIQIRPDMPAAGQNR
jgi:hypothetical protein